MVASYEAWAEPFSARLAQVALKRTSVRAGGCVLDIGAGTGALALEAAALGASVIAIDQFVGKPERFLLVPTGTVTSNPLTRVRFFVQNERP